MILVQLYKLGRLVTKAEAETPKLADRAIDQFITEVLQGRHGNARFEIIAEPVNEAGVTLGQPHYASGPFTHPALPRTAKPE